MPYIEANLSCKLTDDKINELKSGFGKVIECIPGKTENWLMVNIRDDSKIFFKGNCDDETAFISVEIFGKASQSAYDNLTSQITALVSKTASIPEDRIYVNYREVDTWGWNGNNF